jgi:hypothetical protein
MDPLPNEDVTTPTGEARTDAEALAPTALESLVNAMLESGPEVAEHVVRAAQELLLAAQTIVDAAERAIDEQRELRTPVPDPAATGNVHPIDRNE